MSASLRGRRTACFTTFVILCGLGVPARAAPIELELGGEPAPENLGVVARDGERYVPVTALVVLGWRVSWQNAERSFVEVTDGKITAQFNAGSDVAMLVPQDKREGVAPSLRPLQRAPIRHDGQLLLPASAVRDVLEIPVDWDEDAGALRVGTPAPDAEKVREWCDILRIPDPSVFHKCGFRTKLALPQGTQLPQEQEFLLTGRTNSDACIQVFERYEQREPKALFRTGDNGELRFRELRTEPERWTGLKAWRVARWPLSATAAGRFTYIAIATTADEPPDRLLDMLQRGDAPGLWAIDAVELTVTRRGDESGAP